MLNPKIKTELDIPQETQFHEAIVDDLVENSEHYKNEVRKYLTLSDAGSFKDEGSLKNLMEKSLMYQYLSNEELFPNVEYNHLFQKALDDLNLDSFNKVKRHMFLFENLLNQSCLVAAFLYSVCF